MSINAKPLRYFISALFILTMLTACSPATAASETLPTVAMATPTAAPAATLAPTATPTEAPTPTATATPIPPLDVVANQFSAWCLPDGYIDRSNLTGDPLNPPEFSRPGGFVEGNYEIPSPMSSCVFIVTFNQAAPTGASLQFSDLSGAPWLTRELTPIPGSPNQAYVVLNHFYIINPPYWKVTYPIRVISPAGQSLDLGTLVVRKWQPEVCWDGNWPNPVYFTCRAIDAN